MKGFHISRTLDSRHIWAILIFERDGRVIYEEAKTFGEAQEAVRNAVRV